MGQYKVLQPVAFMRDGKAVHQTRREVGKVVYVDDEQADPLVKAGKLEPVGISGPTTTVLDGVKRTVESLEGDVVGPLLDQPAVDESPGGEDSDDQLGDERARRRRGRRSESHDEG